MRKKHDYSALLKYMQMLEEGYSISYIHTAYGINGERLKKLWLLYQREEVVVKVVFVDNKNIGIR